MSGTRFLTEGETVAQLRALERRLEQREFSVVGVNDARWEKGWSENLRAFADSRDVSSLVPKYMRPGPYRWHGKLALSENPNNELDWFMGYSETVFRRWLSDAPVIYEFGCGSGINLATLARVFPDKQIVGLDWSQSAVDIANLIGGNVSGQRFDFFKPDAAMPAGAAALTVCAMEQTGQLYRPFLDWLKAQKPSVVLHIEPLVELYDPTSTLDWLTIKIHEARNFWRGSLDYLRDRLVHVQKAEFGSILTESYSQLVWR